MAIFGFFVRHYFRRRHCPVVGSCPHAPVMPPCPTVSLQFRRQFKPAGGHCARAAHAPSSAGVLRPAIKRTMRSRSGAPFIHRRRARAWKPSASKKPQTAGLACLGPFELHIDHSRHVDLQVAHTAAAVWPGRLDLVPHLTGPFLNQSCLTATSLKAAAKPRT